MDRSTSLEPKSAKKQLAARRERSTFSLFWRAFSRNWLTLIGSGVVVALILMAVFASSLAPYDPDLPHLSDRLQPPSTAFLLGTDQFGRDLLSRIMYGARVSLLVGAGGTGVACILGMMLGAIAGYFGGMIDEGIMRLMDLIMAFPYIVLAIALVVLIGPGMVNLILVIGILRVPQFARVLRSRVLSVREQDFVLAARAVGQRQLRILLIHILPNAISPVVVLASLSVATAISAESALSFLGMGIQPPQSSWGTLLADGRNYILHAPWITTFPGLFLSLTILGYNLLGDGLRDALDPRTRKAPG
jgi:ABC-type dipeptide/oligopeptide/nickel transport system permease subunit